MEEVIELICELIFDGIIEIGNNKRISKLIRYPLMGLVLLLVLGINGLCIFLGVVSLKEDEYGFILLGVILILCGIVLFYNIIKKVKKYWNNEKNSVSS